MKKLLEKMPAWTLTALCLGAILWLTLASKPLGDTEIQLFPHADKVAHAIMFGGFSFCIILDYVRKHRWTNCRLLTCVSAALASIILGIATEYLQNAMHAGRTGDPLDLCADFAGAVIVAAISYFIFRIARPFSIAS